MQANKWFVTLFVLCGVLLLVTKTKASCVCGLAGTDQCAPCKDHTIVRPKPKPPIYEPPIVLPPIGDNCYCNSMSVQPAALPKTCEKHNTPYCQCKKAKAYAAAYAAAVPGYGYAAAPPPVYNNPPLNYYASPLLTPKLDSPPADPVSVSLALQAGKAIGVPEAKLAFGFVQKPIDGLQKVEFSNVPEENLFKLKSEVIELKKLPAPVKKYEEELIIEDEEEEAPDYDAGKPILTYKQLGYDIEEFKNPKFRKLLPAYYAAGYAAPPPNSYASYYAKTNVDCGFRPGRVTSYKKPVKTCAAGDCY